MKNKHILTRCSETERDRFQKKCKKAGFTASEVIRHLMNSYSDGKIKVNLTVN